MATDDLNTEVTVETAAVEAYHQDVTKGLAQVVAALSAPNANVEQAVTGLKALGASVAGDTTTFDAAVAAITNPAAPVTTTTPNPVTPQ